MRENKISLILLLTGMVGNIQLVGLECGIKAKLLFDVHTSVTRKLYELTTISKKKIPTYGLTPCSCMPLKTYHVLYIELYIMSCYLCIYPAGFIIYHAIKPTMYEHNLKFSILNLVAQFFIVSHFMYIHCWIKACWIALEVMN